MPLSFLQIGLLTDQMPRTLERLYNCTDINGGVWEIHSWPILVVCSSIIFSMPSVFHFPSYISVCVSSPWVELVLWLLTSVCSRFRRRKDFVLVCVFVCLCPPPQHLLGSSVTHAPSFESVFHDTMLWHLTSWPHSQTAIATLQSLAYLNRCC